jgi:hypothetical protein
MSEAIAPGQRVGRPVPNERGLRQGVVLAVDERGVEVRFDDGVRRWVAPLDLIKMGAAADRLRINPGTGG